LTAQMVTPDSDKLTFKQHRLARGLSQQEVALGAGVSTATVSCVESDSYRFRTSYGSALLLTAFLGIEVCDVRWLRGLSDVGRPAGSGRALRLVPTPPIAPLCPVHFIALPATGVCDDCS
jgi:transcriptional regulator with XRE-family HTH domain